MAREQKDCDEFLRGGPKMNHTLTVRKYDPYEKNTNVRLYSGEACPFEDLRKFDMFFFKSDFKSVCYKALGHCMFDPISKVYSIEAQVAVIDNQKN